jgi:hypothetical protein
MKHDEESLIKEALAQAKTELSRFGRVRPGAFMLVQNNPQTGARLTHPTGLGTVLEETPVTGEALDTFIAGVRTEAARLDALAVALSAEAEAELERNGKVEMKRVLLIRMEDQDGVHILHAPIDAQLDGGLGLGELMASEGSEGLDELGEPLLRRPVG